jgi:hypothetical protein
METARMLHLSVGMPASPVNVKGPGNSRFQQGQEKPRRSRTARTFYAEVLLWRKYKEFNLKGAEGARRREVFSYLRSFFYNRVV